VEYTRAFHLLELHPIYTHIPQQYAVITLFLSISGYNKMVSLLSMDHIAEKFNVNKIDRSGGMKCLKKLELPPWSLL
jgi:hypothetical protein